MEAPYNPLDKINLGRSVAEALLTRKVEALAEASDLVGAGVYAIYYTGSFETYKPIAQPNRNGAFEKPVYVGKAIPRGARKGGLTFDAAKGKSLRDRLRQHAASISEAANLELADFHFRSLVVDDIWIPLGENMMIEEFKPIWNVVIDGFGNKDPGIRRATQYKSSWDVLHPGRSFAQKLAAGGITPEALTLRLRNYFAGQAVPLIPTEQAVDEGTTEDDD
ncbi:MAG: Eco29kI family restriction endonuclease [Bryobacteraceae bacterium]|nr:Eco29kI family restriction endonuclease [Bryobacteraceae bacterium]